jgi:restriction system protein
MDLPKFHETFIPILEVLSSGEIMHYNELRKKVRDKYYSDLPQELLAKKTKSGDPLILNRIGWGKGYLKQAKLIKQPERAMVKITEKGKKILEVGKLTLKDLKNDPDYLEYEKNKKVEKEIGSIDNGADVENASPQDLIDSGFSRIETQVKTELLEKLKSIDPYYFEKVILLLLKKMGYGDFVETAKSGDGGIDGIINEDKLGLEKIYIQAKRYNENKVREKDIRNFIGAMSGDTTKGIFVTTSTFDELAIKKAREAHHKIILIDGNDFVDLMHEYGVGLQVSNVYEVKEVDEDFFEGN